MNDRSWKTLAALLLGGILISQWLIQSLQYREAARQLSVMQSIEDLLKKQSETTTEMVASLEDLADVVDDIHGHVESLSK